MASTSPSVPQERPRYSPSPSAQLSAPRACEECKRKKTRCDMKRPICSLCGRVGADCVYPTRRRQPEKSSIRGVAKSTDLSKTNNEKLSRLIRLLETDQLDSLLAAAETASPITDPHNAHPSPAHERVSSHRIEDHQEGSATGLDGGLPAPATSTSWLHSRDSTDVTALPGIELRSREISSMPSLPPNVAGNGSMQEPLDWPGMGNDSDLSTIWENFDDLLNSAWQFAPDSIPSPNPSQVNPSDPVVLSIQVPPDVGDHL